MNSVSAPIPGIVLEVKVKEGEQVSENQVLLILEAMKMENEIVSSYAGIVRTIHVKVGESVSAGFALVDIA